MNIYAQIFIFLHVPRAAEQQKKSFFGKALEKNANV
jgi:hypothetical protein